ncbi:type VI secretion system Vgr family protein [Chitinophaga sp. 22536]|uniref:type VI secretion system Vgr family protein n=1 Tax=unclassified Chitinophaga TaxID=2619133 RepID=UPI003F82A467
MPLNTLTRITIDGKTFPHFRELLIRQRIDGHHTFEIHIDQGWLASLWPDASGKGQDLLGKDVWVEISAAAAPQTGTLHFKGLVTAIHTGKKGDATAGFCVLKGTDPGIVLDGEPQLRVYETQTLSHIARHCLKAVSAHADVRIAPGNTAHHPYLVQYRESNYAFLQRLAARFGEWYFYNGQQMIFGAYAPAKIILSHPRELVHFDIRLQLTSGNRRFTGYDYETGAAFSSGPSPMPAAGTGLLTTRARAASRQLYQEEGYDKTMSQHMAGIALQAQLHEKRQLAASVELTGKSEHPGIRIGDIIEAAASLSSPDLEGTFTVTRIDHHCQGDGAYFNQFTCTPTDCCIPSGHNGIAPCCEAQSAIVTDNHDPEGMGRIRIRYRWQQHGSSPWIRLIAPHGGAGKGFHFIPEKGEEVWVDFEGGNPELPFAMGAAYNGKDSTKFSDAGNNLKIIKTRSGHTIELDDSSGAEQLQIHDRNGNVIQLDTHRGNITIASPGQLHLKANHISIEATDQLDMHAGGNLTQGAGENISLYAGSHTTVLATHIIQQANDSFTLTSRKLEEQAESILINSIREDLTLMAAGTVAINSVEKIKLS